MNLSERAEKIMESLGYEPKSFKGRPGFLWEDAASLVESELKAAVEEAKNELQDHWFGQTETDWGIGIKNDAYEKAAQVCEGSVVDHKGDAEESAWREATKDPLELAKAIRALKDGK